MNRRHLTRRRLVGGIATTVVAAVLAACGAPTRPTEAPKAAAPPTTAPAAVAKPTPAAAATVPAAAGGGAKLLLRLNGIDPPGQEFANKFVADYKKDKGVSVEIDYTDWASSFQKISTGMAGGTAPDIFMGGGLWTPVIASKGGALELDSYLKGFKDWEDWYEFCRKDVTFGGKVYAIPYRTNSRGNVIYRKSLFEKAGLDPEKPPTTWEEAQAMAAKLTQKQGDKVEVAGWNVVMAVGDLTQQYEDAIFQAGGSYFNEDRTKPTNATPEGEEALQFWLAFVQKGIVPKQGMDSGVPNLNAYTAGKVALYVGWPQDVLNTKLNAPQIWADTLIAPPLKHKQQVFTTYVDKYFIYKRTRTPDLAWALVEDLVKPDVNVKIGVEGVWGLPARKAAEAADLYKDPRLQVFVTNGRFGRARLAVPQHFDVQPAMGRNVETAIQGTATVKQALKNMDDEVAKILKG